ncbi:Extracellular matrix FRAS1 [Gossypium arboreum]|uniref:Extracellular matrix FRAS1 n=1 Tax=Gossypium arboreum TaxID=29729 RepID=A0A0B0NDN5_GOSAR|nr:Extracellular matrix FRAS1 [Gossypium arboreum]
MKENMNFTILLQVSNMVKDIPVRKLSDDDFTERIIGSKLVPAKLGAYICNICCSHGQPCSSLYFYFGHLFQDGETGNKNKCKESQNVWDINRNRRSNGIHILQSCVSFSLWLINQFVLRRIGIDGSLGAMLGF